MGAEANRHFRQLVSGAGRELLTTIGAALLALHQQRTGGELDAVPALRQASLELQRWLISCPSAELNAQQLLFLASGALTDRVVVKDGAGQAKELELLPTGLYELLLAECGQGMADRGLTESLLFPQRRWEWLSAGLLSPFDFNRPGRYRPHISGSPRPAPQPAAGPGQPEELERLRRTQRQVIVDQLAVARNRQAAGLRQLAAVFSSERLGSVLKSAAGFSAFVAQAQQQLSNPGEAGRVSLPAAGQHAALRQLDELSREISLALAGLEEVQREQLRLLDELQGLLPSTPGAEAPVATSGQAAHPPAELHKLIQADASAVFATMSQYLINHPQRTGWSASRVLLAEHFDKLGAPEECVASPPRLAASLRKVQALHPNCFPLDDQSEPVLPPVIIEPGLGVVKWLDDRFLLSFVAGDQARPGPQLSLTPLDQAALRIYGSFLARGDIWNYRGERLHDSFMAEYAGEVEEKVAVRFSGAEKRLTYGTSAEEKDGASREDAVRDYMDFVFCVFNGMQLPKRITLRKAAVFLKYCVMRDLAMTVSLALQLVAGSDALAARAIILRHLPHDAARVVELCRLALEASPVLQARYRRDLQALLQTVMGREFTEEARTAGLLGAAGVSQAAGSSSMAGESEGQAAGQQHDYFDL